jgi:hypothetical protein
MRVLSVCDVLVHMHSLCIILHNPITKIDAATYSFACKLTGAWQVDALSFILHKDNAHNIGKELCKKLKDIIPRQQFKVCTPPNSS